VASKLDIFALALVAVATLLYLRVTVSSPIAFGDEGYYASTARWIAEHATYPAYEPLVSTDISLKPNNHVPLYFLFGSGTWLVGGEVAYKLFMPIYSALAAMFLYLLFRRYGQSWAGIAAAIASLATPALVTYGVLGYVDSLLYLLLAASSYFALSALDHGSKKHAALAGLFAGLALLTKTSGAFAPVILITYFVLMRRWDRWPQVAIALTAMFLMIVPTTASNLLSYGGFCPPLPFISWNAGACENALLKEPIEQPAGLDFAGRIQETGTEASVAKIGLHNFVDFAFGWSLTILAAIGLIAALTRRSPLDAFFLAWFVIWIALAVLFVSGARAEDFARYLAPISFAIAGLAGMVVAEARNVLARRNFWAGALLFVMLIGVIWFYGQGKLDTMTQVKQFAPGFFDGCDWIRQNTPADSLFLSLHTYPTVYNCERRADWEFPGKGVILIQPGNASYDMIKKHGFDYIYVQMFSLSQEPMSQTYSVAFVNWLDSSSLFRKVYDNTNVYGQGGVRIYQVL
jgi:4-amino-4-deoxy-L-arabinose transferase-like glycosyltransferase